MLGACGESQTFLTDWQTAQPYTCMWLTCVCLQILIFYYQTYGSVSPVQSCGKLHTKQYQSLNLTLKNLDFFPYHGMTQIHPKQQYGP